MRRKLAIALSIVMAAAPAAWATTITRSTKPNGTTSWVNGDTLTAAALNGDIDNIVNVVNGSIDNGNITDGSLLDAEIGAAADIAVTKLGDHSTSDAVQRDVRSPGTVGSQTNADGLDQEIEMLRYAIKQLGLGAAVDHDSATWLSLPIRGPNLIYNGSFEAAEGDGDISATTDNAPEGWSLVLTPTVRYEAADAVNGDGANVALTGAGAASEGISQVLTNLKGSTTYVVVARALDDGTTVCRMSTSGADTEMGNIDTTTDAWETIAGEFVTAAALDTVTLSLVTVTDTQKCEWDHVAVYETNADPIPAPAPFKVVETTAIATTQCEDDYTGTCANLVSLTVEIPWPNSIVYFTASASLNVINGATHSCFVQLERGSTQISERYVGYNNATSGIDPGSIDLVGFDLVSTPASYTYTLDAKAGDLDNDCEVDDDDYDSEAGVINAPAHRIELLVVPPGGIG